MCAFCWAGEWHAPDALTRLGSLTPMHPFALLPLRAVFLSVFKFEARKGWRELLQAYYHAFKASDPVLLLIVTKPFFGSGTVRPDPAAGTAAVLAVPS